MTIRIAPVTALLTAASIAWAVAVLVSACSPAGPKSVKEAAETTAVSFDQYRKIVDVTGPSQNGGQGGVITFARLRSSFPMNGTWETVQLFVEVHIPSWKSWMFLSDAADIDGNRFVVHQISRAVASYGVDEVVAVDLSRRYLQEHAAGGIDMSIAGTGGSVVVKLPSHYVQGFLDELTKIRQTARLDDRASGPRRVQFGVHPLAVTPQIASSMGLSSAEGLFIAKVDPDTPASRAGVQQADILLSFGGQPVSSYDALAAALAVTVPGETRQITIWRARQKLVLSVAF